MYIPRITKRKSIKLQLSALLPALDSQASECIQFPMYQLSLNDEELEHCFSITTAAGESYFTAAIAQINEMKYESKKIFDIF